MSFHSFFFLFPDVGSVFLDFRKYLQVFFLGKKSSFVSSQSSIQITVFSGKNSNRDIFSFESNCVSYIGNNVDL